ncbi:MAG: hypothetical protein FWE32_07975 [Oscillospiraceae bacterium]|nr:hypothetical protein [Oscillospiraceae bacterium]
MHIAFWILLCLLCSIGFVHGLSWLAGNFFRPKHAGSALTVIPLSRDPEAVEQQLRYEFHLLRWSNSARPEMLVLVDTGLCDEAKAICQKLTRPLGGVIVCTPDELPGLICQKEMLSAASTYSQRT